MKRMLLIGVAAMLWLSCRTNVPAQNSHTANDLESMQLAINNEVNAYRATRHLKPLRLMPQITDEATTHSLNMAMGKVRFGHGGFDKRVARLMKTISNANASAENVAYGQLSAKEVVKEWIKSPGHRTNIEGNYNLTGVGIARARNGNLYFTQIFINQRGG
ncbi:CAP domain-containing protein [Emticicia fluvialis]|uniref:CAP domain-containing protein n=1 Tax=Emticicia fluvialis TaxID=2974474 RepID=UPI0021667EF2|nr:CAP domain-containing protein [Emticicia fluvialis]